MLIQSTLVSVPVTIVITRLAQWINGSRSASSRRTRWSHPWSRVPIRSSAFQVSRCLPPYRQHHAQGPSLSSGAAPPLPHPVSSGASRKVRVRGGHNLRWARSALWTTHRLPVLSDPAHGHGRFRTTADALQPLIVLRAHHPPSPPLADYPRTVWRRHTMAEKVLPS